MVPNQLFGLTLSIALKFYASVAKGLKLKVKRYWGIIATFVEVTGETMVGGEFCAPPPKLPPSFLIGLKIIARNIYE